MVNVSNARTTCRNSRHALAVFSVVIRVIGANHACLQASIIHIDCARPCHVVSGDTARLAVRRKA